MQDLIDRFRQETVPLLCAKWPEKFYEESGQLFAYYPDRADVSVRCNSLDSLAAIAEACGVVTCTTAYYQDDIEPREFRHGGYYFISKYPHTVRHSGGFPSELAARLAATIAAIAAIAGGEE